METPPAEALAWDEWIAHARAVAQAPRVQPRVDLLKGELVARIDKGKRSVSHAYEAVLSLADGLASTGASKGETDSVRTRGTQR